MISDELVIGDLGILAGTNVKNAVTSIKLSWTLDAVSQMTVELLDVGLRMLDNNYFLLRRDVYYQGQLFEIGRVAIGPGEASSPKISLECRSKASQLMKRDKEPEAYGGISATDYARIVAGRFGLAFVGQDTAKQKVIAKSSSENADESVWTVLQRSAQEANFVVFEVNNTLYFGSEEWLLGKWGNVDLKYGFGASREDPFALYQIPACGRSDDDVNAASFKAVVERGGGESLRPGMTVNLQGITSFSGQYLVTNVEYEIGNRNPVSVSGRTPKKPKETND
jgi:hypothetical protein